MRASAIATAFRSERKCDAVEFPERIAPDERPAP
jgi:hypothetical protein